jgi:carbonic anhydrase/acetyltransferase-like protein (isoleucine patch superfamily)
MPVRPYLDRHPRLGANAYIDPTALVIGDVELGDDVSVWPMTVIRGDVNYIRIGARSNVQDGSVLHVSRPFPGHDAGYPLIVGEDVVIGHKVVLHGCTVGNRCLVGIGRSVLCRVEDGS